MVMWPWLITTACLAFLLGRAMGAAGERERIKQALDSAIQQMTGNVMAMPVRGCCGTPPNEEHAEGCPAASRDLN